MKKYIMPRGTGKTTHLVMESYNTGDVIVCSTPLSRKHIMDIAEKLNYVIPSPITFSEFLRYPIAGKTNYLIDELDTFLSAMNIVGYSN